jgi:hypothetical protein
MEDFESSSYPNDTLVSYPKSFLLAFLANPPKGSSLSLFLDDLIVKLIWRFYLPRILLSPNLFPLGGSRLLRFTKEGLISSLSLLKTFSIIPFPLFQWLSLGKGTSTNPLTWSISKVTLTKCQHKSTSGFQISEEIM